MNWQRQVGHDSKAERSELGTGIYRIRPVCYDTTSWMGEPEAIRKNKL